MKKIFFCFIIALLSYGAKAQTVIPVAEAAKHIGDSVKVTATVYGGKFFDSSKMTLLDLGAANPNQQLTIMIPGTSREQFQGKPEVDYKGKEVTVVGKIIEYKGKPEIIVTDPKQLKVVLADNTLR